MNRLTRATLSALIAASLAGLAGCSSTRPLPTVKDAGDRAFNQGDFQTAATNYEEFVLRKPGDAAMEHQYARTLLMLNQPGKAISHATIAYDQSPSNSAFADTLAESYLKAGKTEELVRFLRGNTEGRGAVEDYIRLGRFTARLGDADGAELALITAARIDRGQTLAPQLALADFYKSIGNKIDEKKRLRMALFLDPKNFAVSQRLRDLGEIPGPSIALRPLEAVEGGTPVAPTSAPAGGRP